MPAKISHEWRPITDLPQEPQSLAKPELRVLTQLWREQRSSLETSGVLQEFNQKLHRQWAIETGIIERVYSLDRGVTQLLIEHGIDSALIPHDATDKSPELIAAMIRDHQEAIEGIFAFVKGQRVLSTSYIKELHAALLRHQETAEGIDSLGNPLEYRLTKGDYKKWPNYPTLPNGSVHQYCPPEHVASEMDTLISLHEKHESAGVEPEVEAAWLHHAFTQIHPFQDGNGRVARALASLVFIKAGSFPLTLTRDDRDFYLTSLRKADDGSLNELIALFAAIQRRTFATALALAGQVRQHHQVDEVILAARDTLERQKRDLQVRWEKAKSLAYELQTQADAEFRRVAESLKREIGPFSTEFDFYVAREDCPGNRWHYFRYQIGEVATRLGYFANPGLYHTWLRLVLKKGDQAEILLSFHGIGDEYKGMLAASICFFRREETEDRERQIVDVTSAVDEMFQVNYLEDIADASDRFEGWLNRGLIRALEMWRTGLAQPTSPGTSA